MKKIIRIEKELEGIVLEKNTIDEFLGMIRHIYQLPILYDLTKAKNQFLKDGFFKVKIREDILTAKKGDALIKIGEYSNNVTYEFVPSERFELEYKIK